VAVRSQADQINIQDCYIILKALVMYAKKKRSISYTQRLYGYPVVWDDERTPRPGEKGASILAARSDASDEEQLAVVKNRGVGIFYCCSVGGFVLS